MLSPRVYLFSEMAVKLRSLQNCVPCVLKTRSRANVSCVLTWSLATCRACLRTHVPTYLACLRAIQPTYSACLYAHASTYLARLRAHVPMCLACLSAHVRLCLVCLRAHVPSVFCAFVPTCFEYPRALAKNLGKCIMYIGIKVILRLALFSFSPVLIQRH